MMPLKANNVQDLEDFSENQRQVKQETHKELLQDIKTVADHPGNSIKMGQWWCEWFR